MWAWTPREAPWSKLADRYLSMRELERNHPRRDATEASIPPIAVVGDGRLGGAIGSAAPPGLKLTVAGREDLDRACRDAGIALLCVPDKEIRPATERVAGHVPPLRFVGHTSGASGLAELEAAADAGADVFSLHPLQTIPDAGSALAGAPAAIAGATPAALEVARGLAEHLGMRPFEVPEEVRAAYHAAASIASNFLVALQESAAALLARAGIDDGRELLAPLVLRTAANWAELGPDALTGPIARGDEATVERHLRALTEVAPELEPLYEALAARTRELAGRIEVGP